MSDETLYFNALTFAWSLGTWQKLMHEKLCLSPNFETADLSKIHSWMLGGILLSTGIINSHLGHEGPLVLFAIKFALFINALYLGNP